MGEREVAVQFKSLQLYKRPERQRRREARYDEGCSEECSGLDVAERNAASFRAPKRRSSGHGFRRLGRMHFEMIAAQENGGNKNER